ncbi:zona pellucida sperm-binding protein 3-like [Gastrophryne carolinensis]
MGVRGCWQWLLILVLVDGLEASRTGHGDLVSHRRQSNWWQSHQRTVSGQGHPHSGSREVAGLGILRGGSRSGWGANGLSSGGFPRQLQSPQPPSSPIDIRCTEDSLLVNVSRDFYRNGIVAKVTDLTLGPQSCKPFSQGPDSVFFKSKLQECGSTLQMNVDFIIYSTNLTYRPAPPNSPINVQIVQTNHAVVPLQCFYPRHRNVSSKAIQPTWVPLSATVTLEDSLSFSLKLMTDDWVGIRRSFIFNLDDVLHIQASVDTKNVPLILYVDSCVATTSPDPSSTPRYEIVAHHGCLMDGKQANVSSAFRSPRVQADTLQFVVEAFRFLGELQSEIYITCHLKAVPASEIPNHINKACSYDKASNSWFPVEGSTDICQCCHTGNCELIAGQSRRWGSVYGKNRGPAKRGANGYDITISYEVPPDPFLGSSFYSSMRSFISPVAPKSLPLFPEMPRLLIIELTNEGPGCLIFAV